MSKTYSIDEVGILPNSSQTLDLHLAWIDNSFRVSVCKSESNEVIYFRHYSFQQIQQFSDVLSDLKAIVSSDVLFGGNYLKVKIGISGRMELTPKEFFKAEENSISGKLSNGEIVGSITPDNSEIEFYGAFFADTEFELLPLKWLEQIFPQGNAKKLFVQIDGNLLHIARFSEANKLQFYNTFEFKTFEDFAYFTNLVAESLELNRAETELVLSGDVAQPSKVYDAAFTYFQTVSFLQNNAVAYSALFSTYPKHQNIALFSL
ncbi:MAG TPA: DUF3822 family protein [Chitinophagales bacterium]